MGRATSKNLASKILNMVIEPKIKKNLLAYIPKNKENLTRMCKEMIAANPALAFNAN
jgi:hypothetical protein